MPKTTNKAKKKRKKKEKLENFDLTTGSLIEKYQNFFLKKWKFVFLNLLPKFYSNKNVKPNQALFHRR